VLGVAQTGFLFSNFSAQRLILSTINNQIRTPTMLITTSPNFQKSPVAHPAAAAKSEDKSADGGADVFTLGAPSDERGDFKTMLKRGASWAAFFGAPAALGAAGGQFAGEEFNGVIGKAVGSIVGAGYGTVHGGYAGWKSVPGKQAGGIMMAIYMVPMGAIGGTVAGAGLSMAGAAGGWPVAAGLAGVGFALGLAHGYHNPDLDKL
jgi:hypothetical protein